MFSLGGTSSGQLPPTCHSECRWQIYEDEVQGVQKDCRGHAIVIFFFELQPTPRRILHHHLPPPRVSVSSVSSVNFESIFQEALEEDILKGDIWKWDFALKFAISHWNSHSTRQFSLLFLKEFHKESAV